MKYDSIKVELGGVKARLLQMILFVISSNNLAMT